MGEGWKRAIAATKAPRKRGREIATRTRTTKKNGWMPEVCCVRLEGSPGTKGYLLLAGWSC